MRAKAASSGLKRKNLLLDQRKIDLAREILGAATETETIHRALDEVCGLALFRQETEEGLRDLLGRGGFTDDFAMSEIDRRLEAYRQNPGAAIPWRQALEEIEKNGA